MYYEKLMPILSDLESKDTEIAGGSVVGMILSTINSLIIYISNLSIGKKKYEDVQYIIKEILKEAEDLKIRSLKAIDEDKKILQEILNAYKTKKDDEQKYQDVSKKSVEFCMDVLNIANETLILTKQIAKYGNKMLSSDFEICKLYSIASIKAAIVNVDINLKGIYDEEYKNRIKKDYIKVLETIEKE